MYHVVVVGTDPAGNVATTTTRPGVADPADLLPPTVAISTPVEDVSGLVGYGAARLVARIQDLQQLARDKARQDAQALFNLPDYQSYFTYVREHSLSRNERRQVRNALQHCYFACWFGLDAGVSKVPHETDPETGVPMRLEAVGAIQVLVAAGHR